MSRAKAGTMCNLYTMTASVDEMRLAFGPFRGDTSNLPPFGDIYPGKAAPVLRVEHRELSLDVMRWGFPGPQAVGGKPITNVRNLASPFWRSALKDPARRCLVPVTRFCEWSSDPDPVSKRKSKVWFLHGDRPVFAFAGIWRPGPEIPFMAFLTCEPNRTVGAIHPKAMPVVLDPADFDRWLSAPHEHACELAVPCDDATMSIVA